MFRLCNSLEYIQILLDRGANPNLGHPEGYQLPTLHYALQLYSSQKIKLIDLLLASNTTLPDFYFSFQTDYSSRFSHCHSIGHGPKGIHVKIQMNTSLNQPPHLEWTINDRNFSNWMESNHSITYHYGAKMQELLYVFYELIKRGSAYFYIPLNRSPFPCTRRIQKDRFLSLFYCILETRKKNPLSLFTICIRKTREQIQGHPLSKQLKLAGLPAPLVISVCESGNG
jgi:hypothetical protein